MSDNGGIESKDNNIKIPAEQKGNDLPSQNPEITLTIKYNQETGQLQVHGPGNGKIYDEPMCLWLLEKAKGFVFVANARANQSRIITPENRPSIRDIFRRKH